MKDERNISYLKSKIIFRKVVMINMCDFALINFCGDFLYFLIKISNQIQSKSLKISTCKIINKVKRKE